MRNSSLKNKNLFSLLIVIVFLTALVMACSNSPSSVEDYRNVSRKTFDILPEADKKALVEDMHSAVKRGDNDTLRKVLNRGVSPDSTPTGWFTPLTEAAIKGNTTIINSLLEFGANVNQKNDIGMTPLMAAAVNKRPEIIKLLLESKADANQTDNNGDTALYKAQTAFCDECIKLLIKAGGTSRISAESYKNIRKQSKK